MTNIVLELEAMAKSTLREFPPITDGDVPYVKVTYVLKSPDLVFF